MKEIVLWKGSSSQLLNIGHFISCIFILPIPFAIAKFIQTKYDEFEVSNERIKVKSGVFSRITNETELFRIKDIQLEEPFILRLFGLGNIRLISSDRSSPVLIIPGIKNAEALKEQLRIAIDVRRTQKGVLERDID